MQYKINYYSDNMSFFNNKNEPKEEPKENLMNKLETYKEEKKALENFQRTLISFPMEILNLQIGATENLVQKGIVLIKMEDYNNAIYEYLSNEDMTKLEKMISDIENSYNTISSSKLPAQYSMLLESGKAQMSGIKKQFKSLKEGYLNYKEHKKLGLIE